MGELRARTFRLEDEAWAQLDACAEARGASVARTLREAITALADLQRLEVAAEHPGGFAAMGAADESPAAAAMLAKVQDMQAEVQALRAELDRAESAALEAERDASAARADLRAAQALADERAETVADLRAHQSELTRSLQMAQATAAAARPGFMARVRALLGMGRGGEE